MTTDIEPRKVVHLNEKAWRKVNGYCNGDRRAELTRSKKNHECRWCPRFIVPSPVPQFKMLLFIISLSEP